MKEEPRHLPYDVDVEQALLGAILIDEHDYWRLAELNILKSVDFYDPLHQRMFAAYEAKAGSGTICSPLTLNAALSEDKGLAEVGGLAYLKSLAQSAPSFPNTPEYGRVLRKLSLRRQLAILGEDLTAEAFSGERDPSEVADEFGEELYGAAHPDDRGGGSKSLAEAAQAALRMAEEAWRTPHIARILTGMPSVDKILGGLFQRRVTVLGAASSQGKSGLAAGLGLAAAREDHGVFVQSIEEGDDEYGMRFIGQESGVSANLMAEGRFADSQWEKMVAAAGTFENLPFRLDDSSSPSVAQIRSKALAAKRKMGKLSLVIIDHLRLVRPADPRAELIAGVDQITRDIKAMAKDLNVAVLLVSQFNRDFWKRAGHRPMVSDLYGGGSIEQNADHIWFLHREEYYLERDEPKAGTKEHTDWAEALDRSRGKAELFSVKRRAGPLGKVILDFNAPMMQFLDPAAGRALGQAREVDLLTRNSEPLDRMDQPS